jgi:hypothetical protein
LKGNITSFQMLLKDPCFSSHSFICLFQRSTCGYTAHGCRTSHILRINHEALLHIITKYNTRSQSQH